VNSKQTLFGNAASKQYISSMNVYVVILIQTLFGGATHIFAKSVTNHVDALTLTFLRSVISSAGLLFVLWARGIRLRIETRDWRSLLILGFLGTLNQVLYLYGIHFTTAANAALLYAVTPVFVLILSRWILNDRITIKRTAGIVLAFSGVSIVIFERGVSLSSDYIYGNLIVAAAVVAWALFTILGKPMVIKYGALKSTSLATFLGAMLLFPFGGYAAARFDFPALTRVDWLGIFYLGIGTSIIGYLLWYYALKRIEPSKLAVFANGQPLVAAILSLIFLDYTITGSFLVGGTITVVGVILTQLN
jgi:drug/metabolite transporter (DMT)-like permease